MMLFYQFCFVLFAATTIASSVDLCDTVDGVCLLNGEVVPKGANEFGEPVKVDGKVCVDRHFDSCGIFKSQGECEGNPGWMTINW
jgi:hypothetical protein